MNEFWLIVGMMAVTFGVRYPSLALVGRLQLPESAVRALRFVPVAVLTAITVPYMLYRDDGFALGLDNRYLVAGVVAILISWYTKNLLLTIALGLVFFFVYGALV